MKYTLKNAGCLSLERRDGQSIWINNNIRITVYGKGRFRGHTQVLIEAPKDIPIVRDELIYRACAPVLSVAAGSSENES